MPYIHHIPAYRRHKSTGQAVVTVNGRDFYLGQDNTAASRREYDRMIAEWQLGGRSLPSIGVSGSVPGVWMVNFDMAIFFEY